MSFAAPYELRQVVSPNLFMQVHVCSIHNRETGNIEHTRHRTYKGQRIPKGQSKMDNPEKLATYGTQDERK